MEDSGLGKREILLIFLIAYFTLAYTLYCGYQMEEYHRIYGTYEGFECKFDLFSFLGFSITLPFHLAKFFSLPSITEEETYIPAVGGGISAPEAPPEEQPGQPPSEGEQPQEELIKEVEVCNYDPYFGGDFQVPVDLSDVWDEVKDGKIKVVDEDGSELSFCFDHPDLACNQTPSKNIYVKVNLGKASIEYKYGGKYLKSNENTKVWIENFKDSILSKGFDKITIGFWIYPEKNDNLKDILELVYDFNNWEIHIEYISSEIANFGILIVWLVIDGLSRKYLIHVPEERWSFVAISINFESKDITFYFNGERILGEKDEKLKEFPKASEGYLYISKGFNGKLDNFFIIFDYLSEVKSIFENIENVKKNPHLVLLLEFEGNLEDYTGKNKLAGENYYFDGNGVKGAFVEEKCKKIRIILSDQNYAKDGKEVFYFYEDFEKGFNKEWRTGKYVRVEERIGEGLIIFPRNNSIDEIYLENILDKEYNIGRSFLFFEKEFSLINAKVELYAVYKNGSGIFGFGFDGKDLASFLYLDFSSNKIHYYEFTYNGRYRDEDEFELKLEKGDIYVTINYLQVLFIKIRNNEKDYVFYVAPTFPGVLLYHSRNFDRIFTFSLYKEGYPELYLKRIRIIFKI